MDLINMLTSQLGVSETQAKGGAGAIFELVRDKVSSSDFDSITGSIPEVSNLVDLAPKSGGQMGSVGSMVSSFAGKDSSFGNLTELAGSFSKFDINAEMVGKFVPVILEFVKGKGGDGILGIVSKVLK